MKKQHLLTITIVSLVVILGGVVVSACSSIASAQQKSNLDTYVSTSAAATLVQYLIETEVAAHSVGQAAEAVAQVQPTQTPYPTYTPFPSPTAQPTDAPTVQPAAPAQAATATPLPAPNVKIVADQNTNCRIGPSTGYAIVGIFLKGSESTVQGRDQAKNWWYIANSNAPGGSCWVWEGSTTVVGDTSTLAVVQAPAGAAPLSTNLFYGYNYGYNYYDPYGWCGYGYSSCTGYYPNYCGTNCGKCCDKKNNWCGCNPCKPNQKGCNPNIGWNCTYYGCCTCYPIFQNPCKKSSCPAVTEVNYKNYCKNYPQCCKDDGIWMQ